MSPDELEYLQFQKHRHSKSCRKVVRGHKVCRFGAPWPPMRTTQILRPLDAEHLLMAERYKNVYSDIQEFLHNLGTDPCKMTFEEFLTQVGVSEDVYRSVVPPQSWGDRSDTKHSKCLLLGGRRLNQLTLIPKPKGSGGARAATAQVGPANNRNDTKRCLPVEASLRPGEAVPW